jgi:hypothetical protein
MMPLDVVRSFLSNSPKGLAYFAEVTKPPVRFPSVFFSTLIFMSQRRMRNTTYNARNLETKNNNVKHSSLQLSHAFRGNRAKGKETSALENTQYIHKKT